MAITFVTTTSHGSWLPGDLRGYVQDGIILPSNPRLLKFSKSILKSDPIFFSASDRNQLFQSLRAAAEEFNYRLTDVAIESWHLHWIIAHGDDPIEATVGRLKTRMRQALARGRIWTAGYWSEELCDDIALEKVRRYIANHAGCCVTNGKIHR